MKVNINPAGLRIRIDTHRTGELKKNAARSSTKKYNQCNLYPECIIVFVTGKSSLIVVYQHYKSQWQRLKHYNHKLHC